MDSDRKEGTGMTKAQIRQRVIGTIITGAGRLGQACTKAQAEAALNAMIASDEAPEWKAIIAGADLMHQVVDGYLR